MKSVLFAATLLVSLPVFALAVYPEAAAAAGFAKQSLFLSKTPVTEGETVLVHAVVANDATAKFTGDVVFKDGEAKIGSVAVTIAPGGANAVSVSWRPVAGTHSVSAELTGTDGYVVEKQSATFTINEKPKPALTGDVTIATSSPIGTSEDIQNKIKSLSPTAADLSAPIFSTLDTLRVKSAQALDSGIDWAKQKAAGKKTGSVFGTTTEASGGAIDTAWGIFGTILLYILNALRYVVGNAGIFYPVFALLFFYILWRIYKRMRRPSYSVGQNY
jgi:hypothetical protein